MRYIILFAASLLLNLSYGQNENLLAAYNFDDCTSTNSLNGFDGVENGKFECVCGYSGQAYKFDGTQSLQLGQDKSGLNNALTENEFSFAAAILSPATNGPMTILSVQADCNSNGYQLVYDPRTANFIMYFNVGTQEVVSFPADIGTCWQYVAFTRSLNNFIFYLNGREVKQFTFRINPNLKSDTNPIIGNAVCNNGASPFRGLIDEIRIYTRLIGKDRAITLTGSKINKLSDHFQVVFPGRPYAVSFLASCPGMISWSPITGVSDPTALQVELTADVTTRYSVSYNYEGCTQSDTILLKVQDPNSLNCNNLLLPNAFTPNGDNLNDSYGISTIILTESNVLFEIFDMHGAKIFSTTNPEEKWDGSLHGQAAPPGVYMYKIKYTCNGEKYSKAGSVNLIR